MPPGEVDAAVAHEELAAGSSQTEVLTGPAIMFS
jgi:hypothetical protein